MSFWDNVHPKVKAAALTAAAVGLLNVVNAITADYQGQWVAVVSALAPVVAGWLKTAAADELAGVEADEYNGDEDNLDGPGE